MAFGTSCVIARHTDGAGGLPRAFVLMRGFGGLQKEAVTLRMVFAGITPHTSAGCLAALPTHDGTYDINVCDLATGFGNVALEATVSPVPCGAASAKRGVAFKSFDWFSSTSAGITPTERRFQIILLYSLTPTAGVFLPAFINYITPDEFVQDAVVSNLITSSAQPFNDGHFNWPQTVGSGGTCTITAIRNCPP